MKDFSTAFWGAMDKKRVEPVPRMHAGRFEYVFHKYPIKGGISPREVMTRQIMTENILLKRLTNK